MVPPKSVESRTATAGQAEASSVAVDVNNPGKNESFDTKQPRSPQLPPMLQGRPYRKNLLRSASPSPRKLKLMKTTQGSSPPLPCRRKWYGLTGRSPAGKQIEAIDDSAQSSNAIAKKIEPSWQHGLHETTFVLPNQAMQIAFSYILSAIVLRQIVSACRCWQAVAPHRLC